MGTITARSFAKLVLRAIEAGPPDIRNRMERQERLQEEDIRRAFNYNLGSRVLGEGSLTLCINRGWGCEPHVRIALEMCPPPRNSAYFEEDDEGNRTYAPHYRPVFEVSTSTTTRSLAQTRNFLRAMTQMVEVGEMVEGLCQTEAIVDDPEKDLMADLESGVYSKFSEGDLHRMPVGTMLISNEAVRLYKFRLTTDGAAQWRTVEYLQGFDDGEGNNAQLADLQLLLRPLG